MENLFLVFKKMTETLPEFAKRIEPVCQKNSVTVKEGLTLLSIFLNKDTVDFCDESIIEALKDKALLDKNRLISSKGSIVAKSLSLNIERLNF